MRHYLIALSAVAVAAAAPVAAEDFTVKYSDLNLATAKGQQQLDRRISAAAREYCDVEARTGSRIIAHAARECYEDTVAAAREQIAALESKNQRGG